MERIAIFASFDAHGIIHDYVISYLKRLKKVANKIIFIMDNKVEDLEKQKISHLIDYAEFVPHGEYDFGSYKRAYLWSIENLDLNSYDFVYMINDSVYGPFFDMKPYFEKMESGKYGAFGIVEKTGGHDPHLESWFIGMRPIVFLSRWYDEFMKSVKQEHSKGQVAITYETGFSEKLGIKHIAYTGLYSVRNRGVYNKVRALYNKKMPFLKKVVFIRHNGGLGNQIKYILNRVSPHMREMILTSARRTYGKELIDRMLARGKIATTFRQITYGIKKIITGKI